MTRAEFEEMAIGIETGYTDRNGTPIKVGDNIVIYGKCSKYVGVSISKNTHKNTLLEQAHKGMYIQGE